MKCEFTRKGFPAYWVGGGSYTHTAVFTAVLVNGNGQLPKAIFVKTSGHLACSQQQALVPLKVGNIILHFSGERINLNYEELYTNSGAENQLSIEKVVGIDEITGEIYKEELTLDDIIIPKSIIKYASRYHNRSGAGFVAPQNKD